MLIEVQDICPATPSGNTKCVTWPNPGATGFKVGQWVHQRVDPAFRQGLDKVALGSTNDLRRDVMLSALLQPCPKDSGRASHVGIVGKKDRLHRLRASHELESCQDRVDIV